MATLTDSLTDEVLRHAVRYLGEFGTMLQG